MCWCSSEFNEDVYFFEPLPESGVTPGHEVAVVGIGVVQASVLDQHSNHCLLVSLLCSLLTI